MSHFVVVVVGDDHESQLEPYFEQGNSDDYFMERVEEEINLDDIRESLKSSRTDVRTQAVAYFTKHQTLPDGTVVDLTADEDTLVKQFTGLEEVIEDDGTSRYNRYKGYSNLPALDAPDETLIQWYEGGDAELINGKWHRVYYSNPNAKWDWYQVGGRWSGFFKVKPTVHPDRYDVGSSGLMGSRKSSGPLVADQARKGDIDWDEMRREAEEEAAKTYDAYEAIASQYPEALTWAETLEKFGSDKIDQAREFYRQQPRVIALQKANLVGFMSGEEEFKCGREEYIRLAGASSFTPFAVLFNGQWYERGEMGWFGMAHNEKDQADWASQVDKLFQSLDDDTILTAVDCHI